MKKILLVTYMLFLSGMIFTQSGNITGDISNAHTYEYLPGANIV